ncbi:unnamed protein product [Mytilus coruscus]|uniref:Uncharacterized protein n=1 Tax=Mytilus coruscus TaxID=42192 RepID=A0A6J8CNF9_MYTCO|nr:unnamed protein product [Mytilus coruscus]
MRLQPYTFKVKYKPGPQNAADCLSRLSQVQDETTGRNIAEEACQVVGPVPKQEPIMRTQLPDGPWQDLCADLMGPFPTGEYVFVVVDYYPGGKRKIRTKLPEIDAENRKDDADTRRKDFENERKGKIYADQKKKTRESDIDVGDIVLQKQTKTNKLSTSLNTIRIMLSREKDLDLPFKEQ